jgi:TusA-related sulfurtransferase
MQVAQTLDLSGVSCPDNYVYVTLALDELEAGEILEILLDGPESISNVPRSLKLSGQKIVAASREGHGTFRLWVEKAPGTRSVKCG